MNLEGNDSNYNKTNKKWILLKPRGEEQKVHSIYNNVHIYYILTQLIKIFITTQKMFIYLLILNINTKN